MGPDLTLWSFWWEFNKDPYVNLKASIHAGETKTGSSDWFLGQGTETQGKDSLGPSQSDIDNKIVPALLNALENETNNDIVTGAMMALAKIGDSDEEGNSVFAQKFKDFLPDSNQEISETAAIALGVLANQSSIQTLEDLLNDSPDGRKAVGGGEVDIRTRAFAAYGLALVGNSISGKDGDAVRGRIIKTLRDALESDGSSTRDIRVATMIAIGLVPLEKMGVEAESTEEGADDVIDTRLEQIDYLIDFFSDDDNHYFVRAHAPTAICRLLAGTTGDVFDAKRDEVGKLFLSSLKANKDKKEVIQSCVLALGQLGDADPKGIDADIRKGLMNVVKNVNDTQARNYSMIALAQVGSRMGQDDPADGIDEVSKFFQTQLVKGKNATRPWAALGIGVFGHELKEATPLMVVTALREELIGERTPRVGAYAVGAGILSDQSFAEPLLKKLDSMKDDEARGYICLALGLMHATEAKAKINDIVKSSTYRPVLLQQAAIALGLLGDKNVVSDLVDTLTASKSLSTQAALSAALGQIGDKRSIDPLVEMLSNQNLTARARGFAAVALGIVADKEPLPWNSKIAVNLNYRATTATLNDTNGTGILNIL
jgi:HEAT repeat protein